MLIPGSMPLPSGGPSSFMDSESSAGSLHLAANRKESRRSHGIFCVLARVVGRILRWSWGRTAPQYPRPVNMRDFAPLIRLSYRAELSFKKENHWGGMDLITGNLGLVIRDSGNQRLKMRGSWRRINFPLRALRMEGPMTRTWEQFPVDRQLVGKRGYQSYSCKEMKSANNHELGGAPPAPDECYSHSNTQSDNEQGIKSCHAPTATVK